MDFEKVYQEYHPIIYRLCLGYTNDPHWAKDILQDTFISVWKHGKQFRGDSQISTWIYRIAVNNCIKQLEKKKKSSIQDRQFSVADEGAKENPKMVLLRKLIAELPEVDRLIISLELEDIAQSEIAEILGMTHSNIRVRVHRIKETLSKKFKALGYV